MSARKKGHESDREHVISLKKKDSSSTKKHSFFDETIAAIITPPGEGGIAAVRIAGRLSLVLLKKHFIQLTIIITNHSHFIHGGYIWL